MEVGQILCYTDTVFQKVIFVLRKSLNTTC
jgi:hypothetical protein